MIFAFTVIAIALSLIFIRESTAIKGMFSWLSKWIPISHPDQSDNKPSDNKPQNNVVDSVQEVQEDAESTPKANPQPEDKLRPPPPTFSLTDPDEEDSDDDDDDTDSLPPPQFPALNSAQRAAGPSTLRAPSISMPPPPVPRLISQKPSLPAGSLMGPPPRPSMPTTSSLRAPASGPLPNRNPTAAGGSRPTSLFAPLSISVLVPNPRKKVILSPGHSPLDWANLLKSQASLSGVDSFTRVTPSMLKHHNGRKGRPVWCSYRGQVYNLTPYLPFHPGGEGELRRAAGKDGEKLFMEVHPWVNWDNMLSQCIVGIMVSENDPRAGLGSKLDEMD
jgi:cytochrome b involved in lipid metabolism